jgi:hypothetical protein
LLVRGFLVRKGNLDNDARKAYPAIKTGVKIRLIIRELKAIEKFCVVRQKYARSAITEICNM